MNTLGQSCAGVLLGTAVGDSLGLPAEGLSPWRIHALWKGTWRQRLFFGSGLVSDDTEHSALVALCLTKHKSDVERFRRDLSWKLRMWFACLPPGVGLATARACIKMWLGFGSRSGVHSAGNGPSMRAAIIGVALADDSVRRREFVTASTQLTHTDPKANWASLAVAECAALESRHTFTTTELRNQLDTISGEAEWRTLVSNLFQHLDTASQVEQFADSLGLRNGVTGYSLHSVPVAIFAWLRHRPDFEKALVSALNCGGDTDSVGAIVGAIGGSHLGPAGLPEQWLRPIHDWPFGVKGLLRIAASLSESPGRTQRLIWPLIFLRNMAVLLIVLFHGMRRLLPPYGQKPTSNPK